MKTALIIALALGGIIFLAGFFLFRHFIRWLAGDLPESPRREGEHPRPHREDKYTV